MNIENNDKRCQANIKSGRRCKNRTSGGSRFCYRHIPEASQENGRKISGSNDTSNQNSAELKQVLIHEIEDLVAKVRTIDPEYEPPSSGRESSNGPTSTVTGSGLMSKVRKVINEGLFDPETLKGIWYMLNYTAEYQGDMIRRRLKGEYETDEWGMDWEFLELIRPTLDFLYKIYWRIETSGMDNIPDYERILLVSNYSGEMPWDSLMIMTAVLGEHPAQRLVRSLYPSWMPKLPFLSSGLVKIGQALASYENGVRLLDDDELVCVYPEASRNFSKVFKNRYELGRFESSDFIRMALTTGTPVIPVSVVGAEETYVPLAQIALPEDFDSFPHLPITLRFPWLGLLGTVPLPSKWYIDFGEPLSLAEYSPIDAENLTLVSELADEVRDEIQSMVNNRLAKRRSIFF